MFSVIAATPYFYCYLTPAISSLRELAKFNIKFLKVLSKRRESLENRLRVPRTNLEEIDGLMIASTNFFDFVKVKHLVEMFDKDGEGDDLES